MRRETSAASSEALLVALIVLIGLLSVGCARATASLPGATLPAELRPTPTASATRLPVAALQGPSVASSPVLPQSTPTLTPTPILDATGIADPGPFVMDGSHCGIQLPLVATPELATDQIANPNPSLMDVPGQVRPAVAFMLANPEKVGLAAYEVGREGEGVYLNADNPLPLASVVKVLHLVSYARAVQVGELDPDTVVPLAELERYYLPNSDLGSHPRAVAALVSEERVFGDPPAILLEDVPRMMIEFSSNAAADYLHMLLGQQRIEETAIALGFARQTAPCPFLGQFLLMGHRDEGLAPVTKLVQDLPRYSREVMAVTEQYSGDQEFRDEAGGWQRANRPTIEAQQLFSEQLNPHGSAREYANLMAQIALNTLGPWEESVRIRRYLEWPTHFTENQERLAWLGYKGGSLPGVLTVVYYAQPWDTTQPVVVALFYHDLPLETYREWRRSLPHDELARWLLRDRRAIPMIRDLLG